MGGFVDWDFFIDTSFLSQHMDNILQWRVYNSFSAWMIKFSDRERFADEELARLSAYNAHSALYMVLHGVDAIEDTNDRLQVTKGLMLGDVV